MLANTLLTPEELQDLYTELDQNTPVMLYRFVLNPDGTTALPYVSRGVEEIYGVTVAQVISNEHNLTAFVHPDHKDSLAASIAQSAQTLTPWYWEGRIVRLDGQVRWIRGTSRPRMIGAQVVWDGVVMDITESMRLREAEREAAEQQAIIREQSQMLAELSTPLIPISDGVLVMPLIGAISDRRAQQVMETLLEGIVHYQAETVLLDITGVKMVDTSVANALIQVARAVNLIGAHLVLTGIQPRIAQTLVQLGVSLGDIVTYSTLQAGIASILTRQRQVVLEVGRRGGS